ncbi:MAG: hypothetical protein ACE5Q3_04715, partial [Alphaproteobacteria bacterium]
AVGRISAQVNHAHLDLHHDSTGHFGFLEAEDDPEIFAALLGKAEHWLSTKGMDRVTGPFSLSINDESGLLVEGFETPPYLMMGHARTYYGQRLQEFGYGKAKDLIAYLYDMQSEVPASVSTFLARAWAECEMRVRPLDMSRFGEELVVIVNIFNDAWAQNWGYVPLSDAEVGYMAKNLKPLIRSELGAIAEVDGEPVAMAVSLPNVNEAIADLGGRLLPFGWFKLLWRLKVRGTTSARMPLMGVRQRYHGTPLGAALAVAVIEPLRRFHAARGVRWAELSWILEDNQPTRRLVEMMGGRAYKTYRIYTKELS